jgi:hypothetical protein
MREPHVRGFHRRGGGVGGGGRHGLVKMFKFVRNTTPAFYNKYDRKLKRVTFHDLSRNGYTWLDFGIASSRMTR